MEISPDIVISDVDPLPVLVCSELHIPAFIVGNFTWDWIHTSLFPQRKTECDLLADAYSGGTYLRLPMGPAYSPCAETAALPLLPGGPPGDPARARRLIGDREYTLLAFREMPHGGLPETFDSFTVSSMEENLLGADLCITPGEMEAASLTYSDLVAGASEVYCRAGYGILSQIIAENRDAVVLTGRTFPEEPYLMAGWKSFRQRPETGAQIRKSFLETFMPLAGL